ncbi:RNA polymerase sigma factor [Maribellus sediminis]|uniref:RNA polymerase sigma factor n=1 Tax=Maribellus sediminis TaxID=2696285 RepID=UPI001431A79E|nr:RNA polymerase sigma-70 factor [Maribellus sediminis]
MLKDKTILSKIRAGDERAYRELFNIHYRILVQYADRFLNDIPLAEDVVQGVFIYLWENASKIELTQSLKSYLFKAVKNSCLNQLRAIQIYDKHQILYLEAALLQLKEEEHHDTELLEEVQQALMKLPEKMYQIFFLRFKEELSIKEIAQNLSVSENTVKSHLFKGRIILRKQLKLLTG